MEQYRWNGIVLPTSFYLYSFFSYKDTIMTVKVTYSRGFIERQKNKEDYTNIYIDSIIKPFLDTIDMNLNINIELKAQQQDPAMIVKVKSGSLVTLVFNLDYYLAQSLTSITRASKHFSNLEDDMLGKTQIAYVYMSISRDILVYIMAYAIQGFGFGDTHAIFTPTNKFNFYINEEAEYTKYLIMWYNFLTRKLIHKVRNLYPDVILLSIDDVDDFLMKYKRQIPDDILKRNDNSKMSESEVKLINNPKCVRINDLASVMTILMYNASLELSKKTSKLI